MKALGKTARALLRSPGFTTTVVATLALGIGAGVLIFSIVDAVLLRPLPYPEPDRLTMVWSSNPGHGWTATYVSPADFLDLRAGSDEPFEGLAAYVSRAYSLVEDGNPIRVEGVRVSASLFSVLGVTPVVGRGFLPEDDSAGAEPVAVLSQGLWRRSFGADPAVVGSSIDLGGTLYTVVGVMPEGFGFPGGVDLWVPLAMPRPEAEGRQNHYLTLLGRLRPGVSLLQADSALDGVAARLERTYPETNEGWSVHLVPLHEQLVGGARPVLLVLLGAVALLLLIPCANVANLLLARSTVRSRDLALRSALGATRGRLVRETLGESLLLSLGGGVLGVALAALGHWALKILQPGGIPRLAEVGLDLRVIAFAVGASLVTGLIIGLAPIVQLSPRTLHAPLTESGATGMVRPRSRYLRNALVTVQVALAAVLLVGSGLTIRSLTTLLETDPGFDPEDAIDLRIELSPNDFPQPHRMVGYYEEVLEQAATVSGVDVAGMATSLPLTEFFLSLGFEIEGRARELPDERLSAGFDAVSPGYFEAMGITLLQGRPFDQRDHADAPGVAIINRTMAERFWSDRNPIGETLILEEDGSGVNPHRIVGVVEDVKHSSLAAEIGPAIYTSFRQHPFPFMDLVVRGPGITSGGAGAVVRQKVWEADHRQVVGSARGLEQVVSSSLGRTRFQMIVLVLFAAIALALATIGIYGMVSYSVARRRWELAVRMALGARPGETARRVVFEGLALAALGAALGLGTAFALGRAISGVIHGVEAHDVWTFTLTFVLLIAVALVSSYLPARRIVRIDPMRVLRIE